MTMWSWPTLGTASWSATSAASQCSMGRKALLRESYLPSCMRCLSCWMTPLMCVPPLRSPKCWMRHYRGTVINFFYLIFVRAVKLSLPLPSLPMIPLYCAAPQLYFFWEKGNFIDFMKLHQDDTMSWNFPDICQMAQSLKKSEPNGHTNDSQS